MPYYQMNAKKKTITLFYRKPGINYSIEKVFNTIIPELRAPGKRYKKVCVKTHRVNPFLLIFNMAYCSLKRGNVNHITGDIHYCNLLLPKRNTILTIHDLVLLDHNKGAKRAFFWLLWFYIPIQKAKIVTCISQKTKSSLVKLFNCNENKIRVIYNPLNPDFQYATKKFCKENPTILHIGTRSNKNLPRVIRALKGISCKLRIIGTLTSDLLDLLQKNKINFTNACDLSDGEILHEYRKCDIVSFPSTYEGFGMPIIEGQATGRVVITSLIDPMKEIAANGAILVDPFEVNSIREGFKIVIENEKLRNQIISLGLQNIKRFSVTNISKQYIKLYNEILK